MNKRNIKSFCLIINSRISTNTNHHTICLYTFNFFITLIVTYFMPNMLYIYFRIVHSKKIAVGSKTMADLAAYSISSPFSGWVKGQAKSQNLNNWKRLLDSAKRLIMLKTGQEHTDYQFYDSYLPTHITRAPN